MEGPIVTVKNGKLRGKVSKNYDGDKYYSFQGIPYAKPPIGPLRFKAPSPPEPWNGIKDATQNGNDCISYNKILKRIVGAENCLFLNVYTRELPDKNKQPKPVMFWIHGGAFISGSGSTLLYGPEFLLTQDIVLVTINYRVGLLGFLNFKDPSLEIFGNMGLKDQVLALKWVQENISQFNGNPNNVTVFGESAGAVSAHYLLLSPLAKGLFHKCIMQSGSISCWWAKGQNSHSFITEALGIQTKSEKEVLNILQSMSAMEIIEMQNKMTDIWRPSFHRCIGPVVECKSQNAFLTEEPENIIKSGNYCQVPIIMGFTSREGMIFDYYDNEIKQHGHAIQDFETMIPYSFNSENKKYLANKIKQFYYGEQKPSESNKNQYYLLLGDVAIVWPTFITIKQGNSTSNAPIYLYKFSLDASLNYVKKMLNVDSPGASHADELGYLFKSFMAPEIIPNSVEEVVMKKIVTLWSNFATCGNPNLSNTGSKLNVEWKPVEGNNLYYLEFGDNLTVGLNPEENRSTFWDELLKCKTTL